MPRFCLSFPLKLCCELACGAGHVSLGLDLGKLGENKTEIASVGIRLHPCCVQFCWPRHQLVPVQNIWLNNVAITALARLAGWGI